MKIFSKLRKLRFTIGESEFPVLHFIESKLEEILKTLLQTKGVSENSETRKIAVRWLNRLCYDLGEWNESFVSFLKTYPGFNSTSLVDDYREFLSGLDQYLESLSYGEVENSLCNRLRVLRERFAIDFEWLKEEDEKKYDHVLGMIDLTATTPALHMHMTFEIVEFIAGLFGESATFGVATPASPSNQRWMIKWQMRNNDKVIWRIREYELASQALLKELNDLAIRSGISLLTIKEYEEALSAEGEQDSRIIVLGGITMGDSYKAGQVGAMGPNAQARDMTFNQIWNEVQESVDLPQLANELSRLRHEMTKQAVDAEHDIAISEVAKAEAEAKAGNGSKVIAHLKAAGKFALDVGTQIGAGIAVEVIKKSIGM